MSDKETYELSDGELDSASGGDLISVVAGVILNNLNSNNPSPPVHCFPAPSQAQYTGCIAGGGRP